MKSTLFLSGAVLCGAALGVWSMAPDSAGAEPRPADGASSGLAPQGAKRDLAARASKARAEAEADAPTSAMAPTLAGRPTVAPQRGRDVPSSLPHPSIPPDAAAMHAQAFAEAIERGADKPGESAFRGSVAAFMQHNRALAKQQAAQEGLTLEEVEELTYFGLMAQETQRWDDVGELVGQALTAQQRTDGTELLNRFNRAFKREMRALVAEGASAEDRWALIQQTQRDYRQAYFELTGMNDALLDDLLAGDAGRRHAPGSEAPPEDAPPAEAPPEPAPRPDDAPED